MQTRQPTTQLPCESGEVAEFQGLYGAFEFPERLLQKIWHLGHFLQAGLRTADGRALEIIAPGDWNRVGGGPDFHGAQLRIGGVDIRGDVELHFHPRDWHSHGHHRNPAFDDVALHVSLFAPDSSGFEVRKASGDTIPLLVLLPHLTCSIEEFALDDALENVTGAAARSGLSAFLRGGAAADTIGELARFARKRWDQKVGFARLRIEKLGWDGACHHTALEILGYRHNRAPMLSVAEAFPLTAWAARPEIDQLLFCGGTRWRTLGARPANHPRVRLGQYLGWTAAVPDWPARLAELDRSLPRVDDASPLTSTAEIRKREGFAAIRERFAAGIVGGAVGSTRLDTLVTNGFLPLLEAHGSGGLFTMWCCWFAGDSPDWLKAALRDTPAVPGKRPPLCEGLVQGALQLALEQPAAGSQLGRQGGGLDKKIPRRLR